MIESGTVLELLEKRAEHFQEVADRTHSVIFEQGIYDLLFPRQYRRRIKREWDRWVDALYEADKAWDAVTRYKNPVCLNPVVDGCRTVALFKGDIPTGETVIIPAEQHYLKKAIYGKPRVGTFGDEIDCVPQEYEEYKLTKWFWNIAESKYEFRFIQ